MALISISELTPAKPNGANATISFDHGAPYDITISDPFSEAQEQLLAWYFEKHLEFPFKDHVKAQQCAASVTTYGEILFQQVFGDREVYADYLECVRSGLTNVQIEIAGSPSFQRWHWEALKDPKLERPLVLQATMLRKNLHPQNMKITLRPSTTINILVVTARPSGKMDVGYRTISRPMVEALRNANVPVQIDILRPGTYQALFEHLRDSTTHHGVGYYHVIHFDVHGALLSYEKYCKQQEKAQTSPHLYQQTSRYGRHPLERYAEKKAFLALEDVEDDAADLVEASELASLLIDHHIPIAMLNACQSGMQEGTSETSLGSRLVSYGVQMVLAMGYSVTVSAAELLSLILRHSHGRPLGFFRYLRGLSCAHHLVGCGGYAEHFHVWPAQRRKAAHDECRQALGADGELKPDHCELGVPIVGEPIRPHGIGHGEEIGDDVGWRQRVRFRCAQDMPLIVEDDHSKGVAQALDQRLAQGWISAILAHLFSLRPFDRPRIDRQQQGRSFAVDLDLDGASVM